MNDNPNPDPAPEFKAPASIPPEEIDRIALDLFKGQIFTSAHLKPEDLELFWTIFMPFALHENPTELLKGVGLVYEYLEKAGPRTINGYPIFFSAHLLNIEDAEKVLLKYKALEEAAQETLQNPPETP